MLKNSFFFWRFREIDVGQDAGGLGRVNVVFEIHSTELLESSLPDFEITA